MNLITYLPFYRLHEVEQYFLKNACKLNVNTNDTLVFVDNVFHQNQKALLDDILKVPWVGGNWGSRGATWFAMLKEVRRKEGDFAIFIDSDNIIGPEFKDVIKKFEASEDAFGILDWEKWYRGPSDFIIRSEPRGKITIAGNELPIFYYKVYDRSLRGLTRGGSPFFFGPKQVIGLRKLPDEETLRKLEIAFLGVQYDLRKFISDETVLGVLMHLMGISKVPWTVASHHFHHGSTQDFAFKPFVAMAHAEFGRNLYHEFHLSEFRRYWLKYKLSFLLNEAKLSFHFL
jgi:hypothetical protein